MTTSVENPGEVVVHQSWCHLGHFGVGSCTCGSSPSQLDHIEAMCVRVLAYLQADAARSGAVVVPLVGVAVDVSGVTDEPKDAA